MSRTAGKRSARNIGTDLKFHLERGYWDQDSTAHNCEQHKQIALRSNHPKDEYMQRLQVQGQQQTQGQLPQISEDTASFTEPFTSSDQFVLDAKPLSVTAGVNAVWGPGQSNDVTVRLEADIREDLGQELEYFSQLYKMGSFTKARAFFDDSLKIHLDKPYVFVIYVEMLFRQGSFYEIYELDDKVMRGPIRGVKEEIYPRLLGNYWHLMRLLSACRNKMKPLPSLDEITTLLLEDLNRSLTVNTNTSPGSIEIGIICRIVEARRICDDDPNDFLIGGRDFADVLQTIYNHLLREGRVWDMQVLLEVILQCCHEDMLPSFAKITGHSFVKNGLMQIIKDWTYRAQEDASTTLALLDLLSKDGLRALTYESIRPTLEDYIDLATPLALSLAQKDPTLTKSRGYTQWVIAKACVIAFQDPDMFNYRQSLESSPGISFMEDQDLPIYIPNPIYLENPGWHRPQISPDIVKAMKLAVNNARDLGDYETEDWALRYLIMISDDPVAEFDDLCELLYHIKGHITEYLEILLSGYLISNSEQSKMRLKEKFEELTSSHNLEEAFSPDLLWQTNVILYALEKEGPKADLAIKAAAKYIAGLDDDLLAKIESKFPSFQQEVNRWRAAGRHRRDDVDLEEEQTKLDKIKDDIALRQANLDRRREDADAGQQKLETKEASPYLRETIDLTDELGLVVTPQFSQNNTVTVIVKGIDDAADKKMTVRPRGAYKSPTSVQEHAQASGSGQTKSVSFAPQQDVNDLDHLEYRSPSVSSRIASDLGESRIEPIARQATMVTSEEEGSNAESNDEWATE
ncbi:hypothetical protein E8E14_010187 [Neopestalotiopsis sp. 37M]|nr:hypothetical protein E8E14_010187 [Neopestalotiopsis sp. 37M]